MYDPYISFEQTVLPNGLKIYALHVPNLPFVYATSFFRSGMYDDPAGKAGVAHFLEHMICANSGKTLGQIRNLLGRDGGGIVANTNYYRTCYGFKALTSSGNFDEFLQFWGQAVFERPLEDYFEREQKIIRSEIDKKFPNEMMRAHREKVHRMMFLDMEEGKAESPLGSRESFELITIEDLISQRDRLYLPQNACLVCVGGMSLVDVVASVEQTVWSDVRAGGVLPAREPLKEALVYTDNLYEADLSHGGKSSGTSSVSWGAVLPEDTSYDTCQLTARMLSMQLTQRLREERGLVYTAGARSKSLATCTPFEIYVTSFPRSELAAVSELVWEEVSGLSSQVELFNGLKERAKISIMSDDQNFDSICRTAVSDLSMYGKILTRTAAIDDVNRLTMDDVLQFVSVLQKDRMFELIEHK